MERHQHHRRRSFQRQWIYRDEADDSAEVRTSIVLNKEVKTMGNLKSLMKIAKAGFALKTSDREVMPIPLKFMTTFFLFTPFL